jgi:hypothetical protein
VAPAIQPVPVKASSESKPKTRSESGVAGDQHLSAVVSPNASNDDGTRQLLQWGGWTFGTGIFFALLTRTLFGGIGPQGPHTNSGWMALIVTMMCLPFGFLLLLLGVLKWLRNRRNTQT